MEGGGGRCSEWGRGRVAAWSGEGTVSRFAALAYKSAF